MFEPRKGKPKDGVEELQFEVWDAGAIAGDEKLKVGEAANAVGRGQFFSPVLLACQVW